MTLPAREYVLCPICEADHARFWGHEYKGHTIVKCTRCGLRYVNPRRMQEENLHVYGDDYFTRQRRAERNLDTLVYQVTRDLRSIRRIFHFVDADDPRILDVGTGTGFLLRTFRNLGFHRVAGTDVTDANRELLQSFSIPMHVGELSQLHIGQHDIVTAHHVLEHVMDPCAFLSDLRSVVAERGIIHLLLPNEGSLNSRVKSLLSKYKLKSKAYKHLSPGHHLYFYEATTLQKLLAKCGFDVLYLGTRAQEKRRGLINRLFHNALDAFRWNSWLELVARNA